MKFLLSHFSTRHSFLLLAILSVVLASCKDDEESTVTPDPTETIASYVAGADDFSLLDSALQITGLNSALEGSGPFTVFAPSNQAFEAFLSSSDEFSSLSDISVESLTQLLQYHVTQGSVASTALTDGQSVPTLLDGESLTIGVDGNGVTVNGVTVSNPDITATNGIVHGIDEILVPEGFTLEPAGPDATIAEIATGNENLSILVQALNRFPSLLETVSDPNASVTVFAPTNEAFASLLSTLSDALGTPVEGLDDIPDYVLQKVLTYHLLDTAKTASELGTSETTLEGTDLAIASSGGTVTINESAQVVADLADVQANNGVVHVIDEVLVPSFILKSLGTVLQPAIFDAEGRFTTLANAVETADLAGALTAEDATLTVFAPTNDAFAAYIDASGIGSAEELLASDALADILTYHVLGSTINSGQIEAGATTVGTLLEGSPVYISNNGDAGIFINASAEVIVPDIEGGNGVVHAINGVLTPPTKTVAQIAIDASTASEPEFTILVAALQNASGDLVSLLQSTDSYFTVFAPTDQAFIEAGIDSPEAAAQMDPATLESILLYHVIDQGAVLSTDLTSVTVSTAGGDITIDLSDGVTIEDNNDESTDATVVTPDQLGTNGVIHIIDQVLLPE